MQIVLTLLILLFAASVNAQELLLAQTNPPRLEWGFNLASSCTTPTPSVTVRTRPTATSTTYTTVATLAIPTPPPTVMTYNLPATANNLYYSVTNPCGTSNEVQYVALTPPPTDPTVDQRLTAVETKNAAQDLALSSLAAENASQSSSITVLNKASQDAVSANLQQDQQITTMSQSMTDSFAALNAALATVNAKISALENPPEPPAPTSNLKVTELNADQVEITGLNCTKLSTTGTGVKRIITCVH